MRKVYLLLSLAFVFMLSCENNLQMILPEGPQGPQGEKGEDGLSAFELWKLHFGKDDSTTFDDFLASLKGKDGEDGDTPVIGGNGNWFINGKDTGVPATGKDGQNGIDGITPEIGGNGNWWIDGKDTGVPVTGKDGVDGVNPIIGENGNWFIKGVDTGVPARGKDGSNGLDGIDGVTPEIGENGNWYINGKDTGVPATGKDGADGSNGADGANGKSSYELWKDAVNEGEMTNKDGTEYTGGDSWEDFLKWLQGGDISVLHQYWLSQGNTGDLSEFLDALFSCHCDGVTVSVQQTDDCLKLDKEGNVTNVPKATVTVSAEDKSEVTISGEGITKQTKTVTNSEVKFDITRAETALTAVITVQKPGSEEQVTKTAIIKAYKYVKLNVADTKVTEVDGEEKDLATISFETAPVELFVNTTLVYTKETGVVEAQGWTVSEDGKTFTKTYDRGADIQVLSFKANGEDGGCSIIDNLLEIPTLTPVEFGDIKVDGAVDDCEFTVSFEGTPGMKVTATYGNKEKTMSEVEDGKYSTFFERIYGRSSIVIVGKKDGAGTASHVVNIEELDEYRLPVPFEAKVEGDNNDKNASLKISIRNLLDKPITVNLERGNNDKGDAKKREPWIEGVDQGANEMLVTLDANETKEYLVYRDVRPQFGDGKYSINFKSSEGLCSEWNQPAISILNLRDFKFSFKRPADGEGGEGGIGGVIPDPPVDAPQEGYVTFLVIVQDAIPESYVQLLLSTGGLNNVFGEVLQVNENGFLAKWVTVTQAQFDNAIASGSENAKFRFSSDKNSSQGAYEKGFNFNKDLIEILL